VALLLGGLLLIGGCSQCGEAPATNGASTTSSPKRARERLIGSWSYASVELPKAPPDVRDKLRAAITAGHVVFDASTVTSYRGDQVHAADRYEVTAETSDTISIELSQSGRTETYTFADDDTLELTAIDLGKVVMKRR
jgi:hypothetical protein